MIRIKTYLGYNLAKIVETILAIISILSILFYFDSAKEHLWVKAVHVLSIISWMAGMLYLPRLFVYHSMVGADSSQSETFKIMEQRLLWYILNPGMLVSWITGLWMSGTAYHFHGGWLHIKLSVVLILSLFHAFLAESTYRFVTDSNRFSEKTWRLLNEVPTFLMIIAVIVVIIKIPC